MEDGRCPLRGHSADTRLDGAVGSKHVVKCEICGPYLISSTLWDLMPAADTVRRFASAAYVRQCADDGVMPDTLTWELYEQLSDRFPPLAAVERVDRLLRFMADDSESPGFPVKAGRLPVYAVRLRVSDEESERLRTFLSSCDLLHLRPAGDYLSPAGWQKIWREHESGVRSRRGFVAMSFNSRLNEVWEKGLKLGIEDAKCEAIRIDRVHHNEKICDRIVSEIRGCGFLVADVTRHRQGVYFEAGLAIGLGKPVIWTCRAGDLRRAHFDTRQYNHITWDAPADLREKLEDRIRATILPLLTARP